MKKININLDQRSYSIFVELNLINQISKILLGKNNGQKWIIISQDNLMELFGFQLFRNFKNEGFIIDYITIPNSETAKSLNEYKRIISQMIDFGCDRSTRIIALGGGVVGDLSGFVASSFMRGIEYYQIPTTLLSMVDSSIGGKTGINIAEGKNLIGSIYQPSGVFIDPKLLNSLSKEEVFSGLGEVIKYGAIRDKNFLEELSNWLDNVDQFPYDKAIEKSCAIKAEIVSKDERETKLRKFLNFGHTIGHALEATIGYDKIRHGEAVSYGMLCSGWISKELKLLSTEEYLYLVKIIKKLGLPKITQIDNGTLLSYINQDKKKKDGIIQFVLLNNLGKGILIDNVTKDLILGSVKKLS